MYSSEQIKRWFRKIKGVQLIFGRSYLIDGKVGYYIYLFKSHPEYYYYFKLASVYTETEHMYCYEWISRKKQIQWQMERRAVNIIVRRLIGDPFFEW